MNCSKCGSPVQPGDNFCAGCGSPGGTPYCPNCRTQVTPGALFCPKCGDPVTAGEKFCDKCGMALR